MAFIISRGYCCITTKMCYIVRRYIIKIHLNNHIRAINDDASIWIWGGGPEFVYLLYWISLTKSSFFCQLPCWIMFIVISFRYVATATTCTKPISECLGSTEIQISYVVTKSCNITLIPAWINSHITFVFNWPTPFRFTGHGKWHSEDKPLFRDIPNNLFLLTDCKLSFPLSVHLCW